MAGCLTATTSTTPVELLQAYTSDNEEFYGVEEGMSEQSSASDSDEDELGSSDSEADTLCQ